MSERDPLPGEPVGPRYYAYAGSLAEINAAHQIEVSYHYERSDCSCGWQSGIRDYSQPEGDQWIERDWQNDHFVPLISDALTAATARAERLPEALDRVMRNVVCGEWYDDPSNDRGGAAVSRLHDAEREMWRLYDEFGIDPGDSYVRRRAALAASEEGKT